MEEPGSDPQSNNMDNQYDPTSNKDKSNEYWPEYCDPNYEMPPEIEVRVSVPTGDYFFPVSIVKCTTRKAYFGGYRNKLTGIEYHHASSQTPVDKKKAMKDMSNLRSRNTQTYETRTLSIQSYRESGTQMERVDLNLDNKRDVILSPRRYFTAEELLTRKKIKSVIIQRCWRGFLARRKASQIRQRNKDFELKVQADKARVLAEEQERQAQETRRRQNPSTNADFSLLYNELNAWRLEEVSRIKAQYTGEERHKALAEMLQQETTALQGIQRLKLSAQKDLHSSKTQQMLEQMARPRNWQLSNGEVAQVHTPETQRAQELLDLHNALRTILLSTDERLDVLLHVKWTVQEFDCSLTRDITELIDREADLLTRGRPPKSMESLRARLSNLFLQFLENPQFNPRARAFVRLPPKSLRPTREKEKETNRQEEGEDGEALREETGEGGDRQESRTSEFHKSKGRDTLGIETDF